MALKGVDFADPKEPISSGSTGTTATAPALPPPNETTAAAGTTLQDDPGFRSLPRNIQVLIEKGQMSLADALAGAGSNKPQNQAGQGAPAPTTPTTPTPGGAASPVAQKQAAPQSSVQQAPQATFGGAENRLTAGNVLEGGRIGVDTFARSGGKAFDPFRGQEFGADLAGATQGQGVGRGITAADALQFGNVGRRLLAGNSSPTQSDPFLSQLFGQEQTS